MTDARKVNLQDETAACQSRAEVGLGDPRLSAAAPSYAPDFPISSVSLAGHDIWDFAVESADTACCGAHARVNFRRRLPDGSLLTDPENARWLADIRRFLFHRLTRLFHLRPSPLTLQNLLQRLCVLVDFAKAHGGDGFDWYDPANARRFADVAAGSASRFRAHELLREMEARRALLLAPPIGPLWQAARVQRPKSTPTQPLSQDSIGILLDAALSTIQQAAPILDIAETCEALDADLSAQGLSRRAVKWHLNKHAKRALAEAQVDLAKSDRAVLARIDAQVRRARAAACVLCLLFTGIRGNELVSLRHDCLQPFDPDDPSGPHRLSITVFDNAPDREGVPRFSPPSHVATFAIRTLQRINPLLRRGYPVDRLITAPDGGRLSTIFLRRWLEEFGRDLDLVDDEGSDVVLNPRLLRKTFAVALTTHGEAPLWALGLSLNHVNLSGTERYYWSPFDGTANSDVGEPGIDDPLLDQICE